VAYHVFIDKAAEKDIDRLPKNIRKLVLEEIKELAKDPRKPRAEPLEGKLKPYWKEIYRILGRMRRPAR
jgi:mRNA-degrading endonuclease RelE of RelBE toxin-antitoxin system